MKSLEPEVIELLESYAKGVLPETEATKARALLQSRPDCREYLDFLTHLDATLNRPALNPPGDLKPKIMGAILRPREFGIVKWVYAVAAAALVVGLVLAFSGHWGEVTTALSRMISGTLAKFPLK
jgi:hypothetical protein